MNEFQKIIFTSTMALLISFVGLFIFLETYESNEIAAFSKEFSQEIELKNERIFIIGGSSTRQLSISFIQNFFIEKGFTNYKVYEMGMTLDRPSKRIKLLEEIIEAKPTLVVYGLNPYAVGYYYGQGQGGDTNPCTEYVATGSESEPLRFDFDLNTKSLAFIPDTVNALPSVQNVIAYSNITSSIGNYLPLNFENPKLTVVNILNSITIQNEKQKSEEISLPNEISFEKRNMAKEKIKKLENLKMNRKPVIICLESIDKELSALDTIVTKLKEEKIEIIIYAVPYPQVFLDYMGEDNMSYYTSIVHNFAKDNNLPLYDLTDKYTELDIWRDSRHVAEIPEVEIYSKDIAKFIIRVLEFLN